MLAGIAISLAAYGYCWRTLRGAAYLREAPALGPRWRWVCCGGACFAVAFVAYRGAALSLPSGDYLLRAALTLATAVSLQTLLMAGYLRLREPGQLQRVMHAWRPGLAVGVAGALASVGWFTAATLESAALVRGWVRSS